MANTEPYNATQINNPSQGPLIFTNSLFGNSTLSSPRNHKSFDFSNININSSKYGYLKQYHQTRIYVYDFDGITTGGQKLGNNTYIISGNLPESFNYAIGSEWGNPLSDIFKGVGNLAVQLGSAVARQAGGNWAKIGNNLRSGINRAANFLIWNGAKPLTIQLKIPVIDDDSYQCENKNVRTSLKEALEFLGCLSLPRLEGKLGFYTPAPSPLNIDITYNNKTYNFAPNKARIMVQIGGMLFIDNCIVKGVSVSYPNTKSLMMRDDSSLTPILAEVTIDITTIETLTSDTYTKMLWLKQQEDQGKGSLNVDSALKAMAKAGKWVGNVAKETGKDMVNTVGGLFKPGDTIKNPSPFLDGNTNEATKVLSNPAGGLGKIIKK